MSSNFVNPVSTKLNRKSEDDCIISQDPNFTRLICSETEYSAVSKNKFWQNIKLNTC